MPVYIPAAETGLLKTEYIRLNELIEEYAPNYNVRNYTDEARKMTITNSETSGLL